MYACLFMGLLIGQIAADQPSPANGSADVVNFSDGSSLLGQVFGRDARGRTVVAARRDWVKENLPDSYEAWQAEEYQQTMRANQERRERLLAWRKERVEAEGASDRMVGWIDREVNRLSDLRPPVTPLMAVYFDSRASRGFNRRPDKTARLLRLAWRNSLPDPEFMSAEKIETELRANRIEIDPEADDSIESLLPLIQENDSTWRFHRAATEVMNESGLQYLRVGLLVLPADAPAGNGTTSDLPQSALIDTPAAVAAFRAINGIPANDPMEQPFNDVEERGLIGVVVIRVDIDWDGGASEADAALWIRQPSGDWSSSLSRKAMRTPGTERLGLRSTRDLNLPIPTAIMILESVAARPADDEDAVDRRAAADAAQDAGDLARRSLLRRLRSLALPVTGLASRGSR